MVQSYIASNSPLIEALKILEPQIKTEVESAAETSHTPLAEAQYNSQGKNLSAEIYDLILAHMNTLFPSSPLHHFKDLPHPMDAYVLPPMAVPLLHVYHKEHGYSTFSRHPGNSSISYQSKEGVTKAGFIVSMWSQILMGKLHQFIVVALHKPLTADDEQKSPFTSRPGLLSTIVYNQPPELCRQVIIQQEQIIGHVAFYRHPWGTFSIDAETMILVDSLHRNRC